MFYKKIIISIFLVYFGLNLTNQSILDSLKNHQNEYCDGVDNNRNGIVDENCDCNAFAKELCIEVIPEYRLLCRGDRICKNGRFSLNCKLESCKMY
jgi:hypothetical protein